MTLLCIISSLIWLAILIFCCRMFYKDGYADGYADGQYDEKRKSLNERYHTGLLS